MKRQIEMLRGALSEAQRVTVLTGAGISAESGVPTFRGDGGLWRNHRPEELATPESFRRNPKLVWEFYTWRRALISHVHYNEAHRALAELENKVTDFTLITQNIDGLHLMAGSKNLIEIHGNIWKVRCSKCQQVTLEAEVELGPLPVCEECGGLLRPHVVWFGEMLDPELLQQALTASDQCDVMLVVGTSAVVQPAASFPIQAKHAGALVAEINIEETPLSSLTDISLIGKAGDIIPQLL